VLTVGSVCEKDVECDRVRSFLVVGLNAVAMRSKDTLVLDNVDDEKKHLHRSRPCGLIDKSPSSTQPTS
jgi:putative methionine-R-sulfoxide reductase with GAF domain